MTDQPKATDPVTWEDMRALYARLEAMLPPRTVTIIGAAAWDSLTEVCVSETQRAELESMKANGSIVVSEFIPQDNVIYKYKRGENDFLQQG